MTKINKVKIFGERNTGTNYLYRLIDINFNVKLLRGTAPHLIYSFFKRLKEMHIIDEFSEFEEYLIDRYFDIKKTTNLGWKHALISDTFRKFLKTYEEDTLFLTLTKNPYAWLLSMYRKPYHYLRNVKSFQHFLSKTYTCVDRENARNFENPVIMWNEKNRSYLNLQKLKNAKSLRFEDLLRNPIMEVNEIAQRFNIKLLKEDVENFENSTKDKKKSFNFYQEYYLKEKWKEELTKQDIRTINRHLDKNIMKKFNYKMIK